MTFAPGARLGSFEIVSPLGAGGMGEVFRARDLKLGRDVALKVLPAAFAQDPERLARFRREAQLLAALNHPNVAAIHGLAEEGDVLALALELVEGEDLAGRLARGPVPVPEALAIARQIAEGLEAAHEKGIVHRDLKPANVKLTGDGRVKVLDFGLAKAWSGDLSGASPDLSRSPTLVRGTEAGMILGTASYMSPEQARGKPVDKRADVWAFGIVLYEMLTGARLFDGETVSDVLASVLTRKPDWTALPAETPAGVRSLLRRCLERDPRERLHDIADARLAIEDALASRDEAAAPAAPRTGGRARRLAPAAIAAAAAAAGLLAGMSLARRPPETSPATRATARFEIALPAGSRFLGDVALSPDGSRLVFSAANEEAGRMLWMRPLDSVEAKPLPNSNDGRFPFWSPDGKRVAFFGRGELKTMDVVSHEVTSVCRTGAYVDVRGGAWGADDTLVFAPNYTGHMMRVSASGGTPVPASRLDVARAEGTHRLPRFLPDLKRFLFYSSPSSGTEPGTICVGQLGSLEHRRVTESSFAGLFVPPDALVFLRGTEVLAQRIDPRTLAVAGEPAALGVTMAGNLGTSGHRALTFGGDALAYQTSSNSVIRVAWVGRDGREQEPVFDKESWVMAPRVSPDGTRIALSSYRPNVPGEIWLIDPARRSEIRLTQADDSQIVAWSRGGTMLAVLQSSQEGTAIWRIDVAHGGRRELWKKISGLATVDSWLAGDRGILFTRIADETRTDIWSLDAAPGAEPQPLLATPAAEHSAEASPDGKWFAYVSDMTGREEVYVQRLGGAASPWKVSDNGGNDPRWRADGRELYYVAPGGRLNAVATTLGESFAAGPPKKLFTAALDESGTRQYDAAPDGSRFVMNLKRTPVDSPIVVVLGAGSEVRRKL